MKRRTPTGRIAFHERIRRPSMVLCANCKSPLHGVPRRIPSRLKKMGMSERRPHRPYGGYLCSDCSRELFREKARGV